MDKTTYRHAPTEDEYNTICRSAYAAAWQELQPLRDEDLPMPDGVLACLRAFKESRIALLAAITSLEHALQDGCRVSCFADVTLIVCSALISIDMPTPDIFPTHSIGGNRIAILLQAAKALDRMQSLSMAVEDPDAGLLGASCAEQTIIAVEAAIAEQTE